ncbi:late embryogenesis abundant protein [archaeon]|nr:late embryogenesis abundant protein [archaeon]
MKTLKIITIGFIILIAAAGGLGFYFYKSGSLAKPEIKSMSNHWGKVNLQETEIITSADIYNPNPVSIPINRINVEIYMNGIKLASGETRDINLIANKNSQIEFTTILNNTKLPEWWYTNIKNGGHTTVLMKTTVYFNLLGREFSFPPIEIKKDITTNILGSASMKFSGNSGLPLGAPEIRSMTNRWGNITLGKTQVITQLKVYNPNPFPVPVKSIDYSITMNNILMASGKSNSVELPPHSEKVIIAYTYIDNKDIPMWWVSHIKNHETTLMVIKGKMVFDIAGKTLEIPLPEYKKKFKTNILSQ